MDWKVIESLISEGQGCDTLKQEFLPLRGGWSSFHWWTNGRRGDFYSPANQKRGCSIELGSVVHFSPAVD